MQLERPGHPMGARTAWKRRHASHALAQHRPWLHLDGCCGLAHLLRCAGSPPRRRPDWTHGWHGNHEVRRLAAADCRVLEAVRHRSPDIVDKSAEGLTVGRRTMESTLKMPAFITARSATTSTKVQTAAYWIATALFCLQIGFTAYAQLSLPQVAEMFTHIGFPDYFRVELSWAKFIGVVLL